MFGYFRRLWAEHLEFHAHKKKAADQAAKKAAEQEAAAAKKLKADQRARYDRLPLYHSGVKCPACGSVASNVRLFQDEDYYGRPSVMRVDCVGCRSYFCCRPARDGELDDAKSMTKRAEELLAKVQELQRKAKKKAKTKVRTQSGRAKKK